MSDATPSTDRVGPVVELEGVAVNALNDPERVVLEQVDWTVAEGDYWALVGLHRSGKSDLLALAAGLSRPAAGSFRLFGVELALAHEEEQLRARRRVGFAFPGGRMMHQLTVAENIALPLCYHRNCSLDAAAGEVNALLEVVGLGEAANVMPNSLGRNWLRRAGLARALALRPDWLVLDDPLSGLDFREARWWLEMLDRLAGGHQWLDERPLTIAVACDDPRPWIHRARQFAVLKERHFSVCRDRPDLERAAEPMLDDLMGSLASRNERELGT
jgi:ABC-type transporter Mla maintaining outer membrane lipid asymmetry ATPase subunit MlaF